MRRRNGNGKLVGFGLAAIIILIILALPCLGLAAETAQAKEEELTKSDNPRRSTQMEGVVVTAQKREENEQKVPTSMDVFTGFQIDDAGINNMTELTYFSPNLYSKQNTNQNMIIIRGISSHNVVLNTPAGLFVDDIGYPLTFMQNPDLMDIERIEILRGPQGTLYGRNTESGAINIVTRQPGNDLRGKVFVEPGLYNTPDRDSFFFRAGASVSGPLVQDKLYFGASFQTKDTKGYTENIYNDNDEAGKIDHKMGQVKLRWTPSQNWDISLLANAYRNDDGYGYIHYVDGPSATDRYKVNWDGANEWVDENNGQALHIKYKGNAYNLTSITTRNYFDTDFKNDGEFGPLPTGDQVFRFTNEVYSQELRMSSPDNDTPFEWVAGVYAFHDDNEALAEFFGQSRKTDFENNGFAFFGQASYKFFNRLKLTAGLRFDRQESHGEQDYNMLVQPYSADVDHSELLPKASISFDASDDLMLYATVAKGILAGGYDYGFANNSKQLTFDPETTWNYEAGVKSAWFGNRLIVNASFFYIAIQDKQVQEYLAGPAVRSITNAAEASSKGFELELRARPHKGWDIFGSFGYTDAVIDEWVSDESTGGTYDYAGNTLSFAPEYTFSAGVQYTHESGVFGRADLIGISDFYSEVKNETEIEGYEFVNLRLGYQGESFDLALWCKNVFDKEYLKNTSYYFGGNIAEEGYPRTIGMTLTYRF
jgi:iron complex outermembrane receptor protein